MTLLHLIKHIAEQIVPLYENLHVAMNNAWWIVEALTQKNKAQLLTQKVCALSAEEQKTLEIWLHKLLTEKIPLQYLIGSVPFLALDLAIKPPTLIPRPETESFVAELIAHLRAQKIAPQSILDLCTGSGCIALALAQAFPQSVVCGVDIAESALALARQNAQRNNITNAKFLYSDLFSAVTAEKYDLITANPPYISPEVWQTLEAHVKLWEDYDALVAQENGTKIIHAIIKQAPCFLKENGQLSIEIGYDQGEYAAKLMQQEGFDSVQVLKDIHNHNRVVQGIWKAS